MWRWIVLALVAANGAFWLWTHDELRALGLGPAEVAEPARLKTQVQPEALRVTPQEPASAVAAPTIPAPEAAAMPAAVPSPSPAAASASVPVSAPSSAPALTPPPPPPPPSAAAHSAPTPSPAKGK